MAKLKSIETNKDLETEGVWVKWIMDVELKLARLNNPDFAEFVRMRFKPHLREIRAEMFQDEKTAAIMREGVARYVLKGWKNIQDDDGKDIDYSVEEATKILSNPQLGDLYLFIAQQAGEADNYRDKTFEDSKGN